MILKPKSLKAGSDIYCWRIQPQIIEEDSIRLIIACHIYHIQTNGRYLEVFENTFIIQNKTEMSL